MENVDGYVVIKHRTFPGPGAPDRRARPRGDARSRRPRCSAGRAVGGTRSVPSSVVNISGMSFGALSGNAIEALNQGAGARRLPPEHRRGRDLAVPPQRRRPGLPDRDVVLRLPRRARPLRPGPAQATSSQSAPVRAIEIKLSQGAKPGLGGMLPGAKVSEEIADDPRHPAGRRLCLAEPAHRVPRRRLDARLRRDASPTRPGCRSASSPPSATSTFWDDLVAQMAGGQRGVDFVNVDGGEGGTGAAPMIFADAVVLPVPGRLRPRLPAVRGGRPHRRRHVHRRRQARHPRERRRRVRAGRRHGQRRPRGDAVDRLHPGPEVPHRPLPGRRRHPEPALHPRPRPGA